MIESVAPARSRASARWEPINPAPPVRNTRLLNRFTQSLIAHEIRRPRGQLPRAFVLPAAKIIVDATSVQPGAHSNELTRTASEPDHKCEDLFYMNVPPFASAI